MNIYNVFYEELDAEGRIVPRRYESETRFQQEEAPTAADAIAMAELRFKAESTFSLCATKTTKLPIRVQCVRSNEWKRVE